MKRGRRKQTQDPYERLSRQVDDALKEQAELPYLFCNTLSWVEYARYIQSKESVWFEDTGNHSVQSNQ